MLFEITAIQQEFLKYFKVKKIEDLKVPDGDYLCPVYDEYFNVRVKDNRIFLQPQDFDTAKAIVIP